MSQLDRDIANLIKEIAGVYKPCIYMGTVKTVDSNAYTCTVSLNVNGEDTVTEGVTINAALEVQNGLILVPDEGSVVWVAELDGGGNMGLIKCSKLSKVFIKVGSSTLKVEDSLITLNDVTYGGITKSVELQTQINKLNTLVSHLVQLINGPPIPEPGSGAASALQVALQGAIAADTVGDFSNIINENIKHG